VARLGAFSVAEYQLSRATLTSVQPALLVGLSVGLPRFVARSVAVSGGRASRHLGTAVLLGLSVLAVVVPLALVFRGLVAESFLGGRASSGLVVGLVVMACGYLCDGVAYGYVRGRLMDVRANLLRITDLAVAPVLGIVLCHTVLGILVVTGVVMVLGSTVSLLIAWRSGPPARFMDDVGTVGSDPETDTSAGAMVSYSIRRVPGDIAAALLLTVPTILATHVADTVEAGYVGFGTSMVALVVAFLAPINYVLLPRLSHALGVGRGAGALVAVRWLPALCGALAAAVVLVLAVSLGFVVRIYLGPGFDAAVPIARLVLAAGIPYAVFMGARSVVDAYFDSVRNARNLVIAVVVETAATLLLAQFVSGLYSVAWGLIVGCSTLAVLTLSAQREAGRAYARGADAHDDIEGASGA
jgi:O-antigen/teichoic acid export membrane protein